MDVFSVIVIAVFVSNVSSEGNKTKPTTNVLPVSSSEASLNNCRNSSRDDIMDCEGTWRERQMKDLNDREACCAFVKLRKCVKTTLQDDDNCFPDEVIEFYDEWRNKSDVDYVTFARRCRDDSSDSIECIFLNHKGTSFGVFFLLLISILALIGAFIRLLFKKGSVFHIND
jgi:hypothetical protein